MFRNLLEKRTGHLSNTEFAIICEMVNDDLKFNRLGFQKHTSLGYVVDIAAKSVEIFKRCA